MQFDNPYLSGGANHVSSFEGQRNFLFFGACEVSILKNIYILCLEVPIVWHILKGNMRISSV